MKYRQKAEKVDAIQVRFGTRSWPEWLRGHVTVSDGESAVLNDGDYVVCEADGVRVYSPEAFAAKYEQVRQPRDKNE